MITEYKNAQSDTLLTDMAQGATTGTLTGGNFGTPATDIYLVFDYDVAAKYEVKKCTVAGANLTNVSHVSGANVAHSAGCKVGRMWVAENADDVVDGTALADNAILNRHLADNAVETAKIKDAQITNAKLSDTAGEPGGAWKAWTPTHNITLGTGGTLAATYMQLGKTVFFKILVTLGTSPTMPTGPTFTLPLEAKAITSHVGASVLLVDASAAYYSGVAILNSSTVLTVQALKSDATYLSTAGVTASVPFTWTNADLVIINGFYEVA